MTNSRKISLLQIGYGMILISFLYKHSFLAELPVLGLVNWSLVLEVLGVSVLLLQIFINHYKPKLLLFLAFVGVLIAVAAYNTRNTMYLLTFVIVVAAKQVNIPKLIRTDLKIRIPMTIGIMLLSMAGVITDRVEQRIGGSIRHSCGFTHPNNLGAMLFVIALYWFFLKHKRFRLREYAGVALLGVLCQMMTGSRTSTAMIILILLVEGLDFLVRLFHKSDKTRKLLLRCGSLLILFIPGISIYFGYCYSATNLIHVALDQALSSRLYLAYVALRNNGLSLFGKFLEVTPWSIAKVAETTNAIDNSYMYTLINFGIVMFVIMILTIWRIYRYSLRADDRSVCLCLLILIIAGFVENKVFHVGENIFLLYFASTLFSSNAEGRKIQRRNRMGLMFR